MWTELNRIIAYNPDEHHAISSVELSKYLSPLSKFSLNLFDRFINVEKNMILVISTLRLNAIPLIAYCFAKNKNKDVFVFCRKQNLEYHIKDYCLLGEEPGGSYCFYRFAPFEVTENGVDVNLHLPRAKKRAIKSRVAKSIESQRGIFFNPHKMAIENIRFDQVSIESEKQDLILKIHPGLIIFEDVDDLVYNEESFETFINWIKKYLQAGIKFIFHFSNPYSKYIERLKKETDCAVLDYNLFFLKKYKEKLFPTFPGNGIRKRLIASYNLDDSSLYDFNYEILQPIKIGNLDIFFANIVRLLKNNNINLENLSPRLGKLYYRLGDLYNLSVHPSNYKVLEHITEEDSFRWMSIEEFIQLLIDEKETVPEDKVHIYLKIIEYLNSFYKELVETRRFYENISYNWLSKNYTLLNYIKTIDTESNKDMLINILVRSRIEKKILWNDLNKLELENIGRENISVCMFSEVRTASEKRAIGIACGPPDSLRKMCYLFANHEKVIFLVYAGRNDKRLKNLLTDFNRVNLYMRGIAFMDEICSLVKLSNDVFTKKDDQMPLIDIGQIPEEEVRETFTQPPIHITKDSKFLVPNYSLEIQALNQKNKVDKIKVSALTRFLCLQNEAQEEPIELAVRHLKVGDKIILLSSDNKKDLLDLIGELYNLNNEIDVEEIKEWRNSLVNYIELNELSFKDFYEKYRNGISTPKHYVSCCNWITNRVIGPDRPDDIKVLGTIINDENSKENSEYIFEQMKTLGKNHRYVGKILKKLVKGILENRMYDVVLNYEEQVIYNRLKVYQIVGIEKL